ncbi:hypothetical protein CNYM01_05628 [Colletotrichum nymphaeae SA-01]|uniref:Fucose-specific lectin n=1 Tax=Colletotrichum nymphaeae SA-01 TaxID=1460502 RepID=A0A135UL72_9PEZI|nr:hypothetical protein CNYM01_05628 [Colletotrichum nymphaeae SA-01]
MLPAAHQHTDQDYAHVAGNPYYQSFDDTGKEAIPTTNYTQIANVEDPPDAKPKRSRRRLWLTAGGVTLLIVILSVVLAGVFGSRAAKTSSADQTGASPSPSPSPIATSQTIRQGSSLSVTGWRKSSGVEIFLFYQDVNNYVRCSRYEEVPTSSTLGNTSWHAPVRYNSFATSKSRLAGTTIQFGTGAVPQVEMFYTNDDNRLLGLSINNAISSGYEEDSITVPTISKGVSFAAFSIARESDALQRVNIYILFIDASSDINVLRNSASGWQLTQPAALKAVDSDSDIACLTMATTYFDSNGSQVLLGQALSETRCYFQRGGLVREAMLSGDDWVDLGSVPIP